jgi:hypothetical protein
VCDVILSVQTHPDGGVQPWRNGDAKSLRLAFSLAAVALVNLALAAAPAAAGFCRPANFIAFDEQHCADFCHSCECISSYDPEQSECFCTFP